MNWKMSFGLSGFMVLSIFALLLVPASDAVVPAAAGGGGTKVCKLCSTEFDCSHPNATDIKRNNEELGSHNNIVCAIGAEQQYTTCGQAMFQCVMGSECEWTNAPDHVVAYPVDSKKYKILDHANCGDGTIGCGAYNWGGAEYNNSCSGSTDAVTNAQYMNDGVLVTFFTDNVNAYSPKILNAGCTEQFEDETYGYYAAKDENDPNCDELYIATCDDLGYGGC